MRLDWVRLVCEISGGWCRVGGARVGLGAFELNDGVSAHFSILSCMTTKKLKMSS